jgi:hypothetical protein
MGISVHLEYIYHELKNLFHYAFHHNCSNQVDEEILIISSLYFHIYACLVSLL